MVAPRTKENGARFIRSPLAVRPQSRCGVLLPRERFQSCDPLPPFHSSNAKETSEHPAADRAIWRWRSTYAWDMIEPGTRVSRSGRNLFPSSYAPFAAACSSRAYWVGGRPTCRVKATLKVLAEL